MAAKKKTRKVGAKKPASKSRKKPATRAKASGRKKATAKKTPARKAAKKKATRKKATLRVAEPQGDDRVSQIQRVIDVMVAAGAVEVELKEADTRLRVRLKEDPPMLSYAAPAGAPMPMAAPPASAAAADAGSAPVADDPKRQMIPSPMVGTFYSAPSPDADPFCTVGDHVTEDSSICILEAMKVMNEIKAEMSGEILEVLCQNGEPVEFGQPLFVIRVD